MPNNLIDVLNAVSELVSPDVLNAVSDIVSAHWPPKMPAPPQPPSWTLGTPTIDIVIPCRGDELVSIPAFSDKPLSGGLMMTVTSCEKFLARSRYDYRYYIVSNGNEATGEQAEAFDRAIDYIKNTGHLGKVLYENTVLSPPSARNIGASAGTGDLIFFFDNHCLVHDGYFDNAVETFETNGADLLHGAMLNLNEDGLNAHNNPAYHYKLGMLENRFLGMFVYTPQKGLLPYRIAVAGHGSFAVKRTVWKEIDGYWDSFVGYGGEECYLELKLAMMDRTNWLDPRVSHWHHTKRVRDYKLNPNQLSAYVTNLIASANIIGGNKWAEQTAVSFNKYRNEGVWAEEVRKRGRQWLNEQLHAAVSRSEDRRLWFDSKKQRTLEEQLLKFRLEGVAC